MRPFLPCLAACLTVSVAAATTPPAYHMMRMPPAGPHADVSRASTMLYYGGPVISAASVKVVFWGNSVAAATVRQAGPFLKAVAASTYTDQLAQYATKGVTGIGGHTGTQTIGRGTYLGQTVITPSNTATTLADSAIRRELLHQITIGKLPPRTPNTLYMVFFPASITITLGGSVSCQAFGAYHEAAPGRAGATNLFYGVMPDCGGGFGAISVATSHEYAEAVTDAIPTPGSNPAYPQAWNTSNGYEIGDLCEGHNATLTAGAVTYTVQEVFDAKTNACKTGNFSSP